MHNVFFQAGIFTSRHVTQVQLIQKRVSGCTHSRSAPMSSLPGFVVVGIEINGKSEAFKD